MTADQTEAPPQVSEDEVRTRPFADVLRDLNRGRTHGELSSELQGLVASVLETGKKGSLTLTITVESAKSHNMVVFADKVVVKKPEARAGSIFFVDDQYNVVREDPQQMQLPLVSVVTPDGQPLRKAE